MPPEVHKNELDSNYLLMLQNLKIPPANACSRRRLLPLINITVEFIKLCAMASSKVPQPCWFNTISQLLMQSIIEELRIFGELSTQNLKARLAPELVSPRELEWAQNCDTYINYLQPPPGVHTKHHLEDISDRFPLFQLEGVIIDAIVNLMKKLDPPVLVQLERGKLRGMTVLETRRLKRRLGLP
ncbi:hypothetical protein PHISCL_08280 [Aspergillus sclerotialis]|uniref:Uncharacterized protein n=1 Tax=Aspergillus sclerotialis TaxID=2070753 RepID=A0A3A2ZJ56_9EURO|nr:hypothetical protein PHISCL_08280 [Aspergillus sclerotialis]